MSAIRVDAPDALAATSLMQAAVGLFHAELVADDGRWSIVFHPDREPQRLLDDVVHTVELWLRNDRLDSAALLADGCERRVHANGRVEIAAPA